METVTLPTAEKEVAVYPSVSDRMQSTFIDSLFIVVLMLIAGTWLDRYDNAPDWIRIALFFVLWGVYEPLCTSFGGTLGNHLKGIRVRSYSNVAKRVNPLQAFFRYVIKMVLGLFSFFSVHTNKERRALHDLITGTVMIRK
jgi:uncharacterized RDD family membrane protein YckC